MESKIEIAQELLIKDLNIDRPGLVFSTIEKLEDWLAREIGLLMDQDFQRLLNILYRIDVSEEETKRAFASFNPAKEIARLIVKRELQKVATRERYKGK